MKPTDITPNCVCRTEDCILCQARLFSALSSSQVCDIKGVVSRQGFDARKIIFREGDPCARLYIVKEGMVKLSKSLPDGREQIMCPRGAGQLIGFCVPGSDIYPVTATTLTNVSTCSISHKDMKLVLQQNPEAAMDLIALLNRELGVSQAMICNLGLKNAAEKVASFILSLVPVDSIDGVQVPLPLSRQEIGEILGLTVETVSRVMAEFRREKIIESPRGGINVLNITRLREMSGDQISEAAYLNAAGA